MRIIDLSHVITEKTPVYPGDPKVEVVASGNIEKDGFADHKVTFGTHVGTHIDAPAHMIPGGQTLSNIPPESFITSAVCIDVQAGFNAQALSDANIQPGTAVLFYTGASEYFAEERYWNDYQVLDQACVDLLVQKQVTLVGVDTGSVDKLEMFPVHKGLLGAGIIIIENLAPSLKSLVGMSFELIALPLKLEFDGAPARVIARVQ